MTSILFRKSAQSFTLSRNILLLPRHPRSVRFAEPPLPPQAVQGLLKSALSRAKRTISDKNEYLSTAETISVDTSESLFSVLSNENDVKLSPSTAAASHRSKFTTDFLTGSSSRAQRTLSTRNDLGNSTFSTTTGRSSVGSVDTSNQKGDINDRTITPPDLRYSQNPALSLTALAHWLWASVLRPHEDSAIDATCGNGHDSVGIASILFANEDLYLDRRSELICVDVQEEACRATKEALSNTLHSSTINNHVQILQTSHSPLPLPKDKSSVGLVVYNLGYLPNSPVKEPFQTQVESTLSSIADALLFIRVGGMVSIMTYPKSNKKEDFAVRALLEATVAMTNSQGPQWFSFVDELDCSSDLKDLLTKELRKISSCYEQSGAKRTFRVTEHKKIGLAFAPILITATRIK